MYREGKGEKGGSNMGIFYFLIPSLCYIIYPLLPSSTFFLPFSSVLALSLTAAGRANERESG
jgi:hypothetical protein